MKRGKLTRRTLLGTTGAVVLSACAKLHDRRPFSDAAFGPDDDAGLPELPGGLEYDPDGILDLLPEFSYSIVQRRGETMSDGFVVPGRPDGTACFEGERGELILLRNHENRDFEGDGSPYLPDQTMPEETYDTTGLGGVTRVVLDARTLDVKSSNLVLAGTSWNCSGGPSPWGYLTCEEITRENHGFVFACAPDAESVQAPQRIDGYGRFRHEAAAVDPDTRIAYLTEDQPDGSFYRFLPVDRDEPFVGTLQALRIIEQPGFNTGTLPPGSRLMIDWVDIADPTPVIDNVRSQAQTQGAARVQRAEGIWFANGEVFICATTGGRTGAGQVLRLDLEESTLEALVESPNRETLNGPDGVCLSPHGLLYICEDGPGHCFVRRVTLEGEVVPFARNALSQSEITGLCFAPDGKTLFLSLQEDGLTLAVRGPFERALAVAPQRRRSLPRDLQHGLAHLARSASRAKSIG
jgi:secreted PhoX family phosphatase